MGKKELTGGRLLRRRMSALDCDTIEEEEEDDDDDDDDDDEGISRVDR